MFAKHKRASLAELSFFFPNVYVRFFPIPITAFQVRRDGGVWKIIKMSYIMAMLAPRKKIYAFIAFIIFELLLLFSTAAPSSELSAYTPSTTAPLPTPSFLSENEPICRQRRWPKKKKRRKRSPINEAPTATPTPLRFIYFSPIPGTCCIVVKMKGNPSPSHFLFIHPNFIPQTTVRESSLSGVCIVCGFYDVRCAIKQAGGSLVISPEFSRDT